MEVYDPSVDRPANDSLCNATVLSLGDYCTQVNGNTSRATYETDEPIPGCFGEGMNTVWYSFSAPVSGLVTITTHTGLTGSLENTSIALYELPGGDCTDLADLAEVDCNDDFNSQLSTLENLNLVPGQIYYVQVVGHAWAMGTFCIEVYDPTVHQPPNDDLCDATPLTIGTVCTQVNGNTSRATLEPGEPTPECFGGSKETVWYSFVAPASGDIIVTTETSVTGSLDDTAIGLYGLPGGDCTNLADLDSLDCNDNGNSELSAIMADRIDPG